MWNKVKVILNSVWSDVCDSYKRIKIYLISLVALIAIWEWRKIKATLLVKLGQKEIYSDKKEDEVLAQKENNANSQADALVKKASQENSDDDWYKK